MAFDPSQIYKQIDAANKDMRRSMDAAAESSIRRDLATRIAVNSTAVQICSQLHQVFTEFEASICPDEEIGLALSSFGQSYEIAVVEIRVLGYNTIQIKGLFGDKIVSLVQHISQLSILLIPMKKAKPEAPRRKIGFVAMSDPDIQQD